VLLDLLVDPVTTETLARARGAYAERRGRLVDALGTAGVSTSGRDGINLWVEVADEQAAAYRLAAGGIGVAVGSPFVPGRPNRQDHIRVTSGLLRDDLDRVAALVAEAATPPSPRTRAW
jgi:DNA-binding transcriptional MocR family regulator